MTQSIKQRWFWKLTSEWDFPPTDRYIRHSLELDADSEDHLLDTIEQCKAIGTRHSIQVVSSRDQRLEDFPLCRVPILSKRAVNVLKPLLQADGEFVPVALRRRGRRIPASYSLYNCIKSFSAIDRKRMRPEHLDARGRLKLGAYLRFHYANVPKAVHAFRPKDAPDGLLVSEDVGFQLQASSLSGWMLRDPQAPPFRRPAIISLVKPTRDTY